MKVVYIITRMDEYGGAQVHIRDLTLWLKNNGHKPIVLSGWPGKVSDYIEHMDIIYKEVPDLVRRIHPIQDVKAFLQIRKHLKRLNPDVVSCHSSKAGMVGRIACFSLGIPVIFTAHGWAFTDNVPQPHRTIYKIIEKVASWLSSHVITVSEYDRDLALKKHIVSRKKLTAVHNGMPDIPYKKPANQDLKKNVRLIMIARFGRQKDHETLIHALGKIKDLNWTMDLVGGGDNSAIVPLVDALGLDDKVRFLGEREDIPTCLEKADVYCLISHWEGFPRSILEAMRTGLPVIATNVAGVKESVIDGETGYCPPHKDIDALAENLKDLINNPDKIKSMGLAGRKRFEENFTFDKMVNKTLGIYEQVLSKAKKKA
ncbi:MAG: glycosyltransferase family 4 protein [Alphaproteobacteria bacterium]|nr:glycosyltransferase family 4 protein [Alphaproteobacteria bacterium]